MSKESKQWINNHYKLLWVLTVLTVGTITAFTTFTILVFEREVVYLAGTIATGVLCLVELIIWVSLFKWLIKREKK